jgi:lysophospholipase L1-like esterase
VRYSKYLGFFVAALVLLAAACGAGSDNTTAKTGASDPPAVEAVFIGSSQLNDWPLSDDFPGRNFVKKAVLSDTSALMLARFQTDVIALKPQVVVIWSGENDIQRKVPLDQIQQNITAMRDAAVQQKIRVVLCTLGPKAGTSSVENPMVVEFNAWLRDFAGRNSTAVADLYAVLADGQGNLRPEFAKGNDHLTLAAYSALTSIMSAAISQAEQQPQ